MKKEYKLYINGAWSDQTDGCVREDLEPATGKPLFDVHRAGPGDVERALQSAAAAFPAWSETMADRREAIQTALSLCRAGDVLLLAGKGHETTQEIGGKAIHFDEREEIAFFFQKDTL